ncbi:11S globulin seed storage protein 1 [Sesamum alatum]|uniref:11S globulin seed storage protein 1 n=1 Tax=Sesamum alatum TaxID=300844 RepID=A0AAE1YD47_9LAMI|nr:11S globulin seed storage protein 1 [Sesamum alatum]
MANSLLLLSLSLSFLFLFHGCVAQLELQLQQQSYWQSLQRQQQHRLRAKTECQIQQLSARQPNYRLESEAGVTEYWDVNNEEFQCAGVEFIRHTIQPRGLLLPYYSNAPQLVYIVQGSGIQGSVVPGCAETYESESGAGFSTGEEEGGYHPLGLQRRRHPDNQRGDSRCCENENNQLDLKFRRFFLAGNPQAAQGQGEQEREQVPRGEGRRGQEGRQEKNNIFNGFNEEFLAESFNIDTQLVRRLQGREDNRGIIVRAERPLRLVLPEYGREEQERQREQGRGGGYAANGLEETICSLKIRENIEHVSATHSYNPRGGRISTINSQTLPILGHLRLSAEKGVLYRNGIAAPQWSTNAHSTMYVTRGNARVQVVGHQGRSVFNEEVNEGQLLVIPQNFAVAIRAADQGFEYVTFRTNDNAMKSELAGRLSAIRAMPDEVVMNAFGVSREDARNLKYNRDEATVFSPGGRSGGYA